MARHVLGDLILSQVVVLADTPGHVHIHAHWLVSGSEAGVVSIFLGP